MRMAERNRHTVLAGPVLLALVAWAERRFDLAGAAKCG